MSSKRARRRKACVGKVRHDTRAAATDAARAATGGRFWMRAYRCPHCAGWHIGHPTASHRHAARAAQHERRRTA